MIRKFNIMNVLAPMALIFVLTLSNPPANRISFFQGNIEQVEAKAQEMEKNYLVIVYAKWSSSWKRIEQNSLTQRDVVKLVNDHYVPMKLDIDTTDGALFCVQNDVKRLPEMFIFNPAGQVIFHSNKDLTSEEIVSILSTYQSPEVAEDIPKNLRKLERNRQRNRLALKP